MPFVRYEIRNEYSLANPDLYRSAGKDDPEALLDGMAMAGLVGIVRQLGDLAEFATEIFHDLHEEVMATAARGHGLMIRVQQLEAEFPSVEKALMSEKNQLRFAYAMGADWHASIRNDQNHLTQGDLPRFILNSYEECRGPPRLFLLDKFDVAGAGACLKRYTDPSFFKMEWASTELMKAEKAQRQKKARRIKKKGRKQRNGETADVTPINGRVRYSALDLDRPTYVPGNLMNTSSQKLKSKQVQGYPLLNREFKRDRLKSPLNVSSPKKDKHVPESISCGFDKKLDFEHFNSSPVQDQVVDRHYVQDPDKSLFSKDAHETFSQEWEEKPAVRPVHRVKPSDNHTTVSSPESQSSRIIPEMDSAKVSPKFIHGEQNNAFVDYRRTSEVKVDDDDDRKQEVKMDDVENDDVASEADNYMDALATMESEMETDYESKMKHEVDSDINLEKKETGGELPESCAHFSEFADAEATAFYNCDSSDESSKGETALRFFSNYLADDASNVESTSYMVNSTSECDSGNVMQNGRLDSAHASLGTSNNSITFSDNESSLPSDILENVQVPPDENVESDTDVTAIEEKINDIRRLDSSHASPETSKNSVTASDNESSLTSDVLDNVQVLPDENVESDINVTAIEEKINDIDLLPVVTDAMCHVVVDNIDVNNIEKENDNKDSFSNVSSCAGIDNREVSLGFPTSGSSLLGTLESDTPYEELVAVSESLEGIVTVSESAPYKELVAVSESLEGIVEDDMKKSSPNVHDDVDCAGYPIFTNSNITESEASSELADGMENAVIHDNDTFVILQANDVENGVLESIKYESSDTQYFQDNSGSQCPSPESVEQISVKSDTNIEHSEFTVESMPQGSAHVEYVGPGMDSESRDDQSCIDRFLDQIPALDSEMDAGEKEEPIEHPCVKGTMKSIAMEGEENAEPPEHACARESESFSGLQENDIDGSECTESIPDMRPINLQSQLNVADGYGDDQVTENSSSIIATIQDSTVCSGDKLTVDSDSVSLLENDLGYDIPMKELEIHSEEALVFDVDVVKLPVFTRIRDSSSNKELSDKYIDEETSINDVVRPDAALNSRFSELYTDDGSFENCVDIDSHSYIVSGAPTEAFDSPPSADSLSEKAHMDSLHAESKAQLPYGMQPENSNASPHSTSLDPWTNSGALKENVEIDPHRNLLFVAPTEICKSSPLANSSSERVHMDSINPKSEIHILHLIQPVKPIGADPILDVISPVKPVGAEPILDFIPPMKPVGAEPILDFIPPVKPVNDEPHAESPRNFTNKENFDGEPPSPPLEHIKISFPPTSDSPLSMYSTSSDHVSESSHPESREHSQQKVHELCSFSLLPEPAIPLQLLDENRSIQIMDSLSSHRQRNSLEIHISQMRDTENDFEDEESKPFGKSLADYSPVFYNQSLEPTEGLAVFSGRTAVSDADTGSPGVLTNSMSISSSPETNRNSLLNIKCSSADASSSSSHSRSISLGSSPRSFVASTPHSPVSVEEICHRDQGLSSHSPVLESRAVDLMSSTVDSDSDHNLHEMPSSPPEACYENQDSSRSQSPPLEFRALVQTSPTVEPNSECKSFDLSPPHPETSHKNQDLSSTKSTVLEYGALAPTSSAVEPDSEYKWHDISPPHLEACHKNQDLSRNRSSVLESGTLVLTSSTSEPISECNWNEMPPPPPLPPAEWKLIKSHQMHSLVLLEGVQPPSPPALPPLVMTKSSMEDGSPSLVSAMQKDPVEQHDLLIEAIASHDKTTLKKVPKEIQPIVAKPVDEREVLLEQIRSKSFNLRRTSVVKNNIPRPVTNINVAAILEKANAIRQAFAGSDEEEDDDWSDT